MIHIKKITYDDILTMWTKYMPNMSLEPTSAMSCFLMQVKNEETYKFEFIDHYDLENQEVRVLEERLSKKSITAISIVAHEIGHAIQHKEK